MSTPTRTIPEFEAELDENNATEFKSNLPGSRIPCGSGVAHCNCVDKVQKLRDALWEIQTRTDEPNTAAYAKRILAETK